MIGVKPKPSKHVPLLFTWNGFVVYDAGSGITIVEAGKICNQKSADCKVFL